MALIRKVARWAVFIFAPVWPTFVPPLSFAQSLERRGTALPGDLRCISQRPRRRHNEGVWLSASCLSVNDFTGLLARCFRHLAFILSALPPLQPLFVARTRTPDPTGVAGYTAAAGVFIYLPGGLAQSR